MTTQTATQAEIDRQQAALNEQQAARTAQAVADRQKFAKAVSKKLAGVPMHNTHPGEVALVVLAVLEVLEVANGAKHPA